MLVCDHVSSLFRQSVPQRLDDGSGGGTLDISNPLAVEALHTLLTMLRYIVLLLVFFVCSLLAENVQTFDRQDRDYRPLQVEFLDSLLLSFIRYSPFIQLLALSLSVGQ